jgi:hypothetical protein
MFRHRHRRPPPFAKFINWTDYRWEPNAWRNAATQPWIRHAPRRRRYTFLQIFLAGLAVVAGLKLMSALQNSASALQNSAFSLRNSRNQSWVERGALAVLVLMVASYLAKRRERL